MTKPACTDQNPEIWFAPTLPHPNRDVWATARAICNRCPVRQKCLNLALELEAGTETRHGMWGGLAPEERAELVRGGAA